MCVCVFDVVFLFCVEQNRKMRDPALKASHSHVNHTLVGKRRKRGGGVGGRERERDAVSSAVLQSVSPDMF